MLLTTMCARYEINDFVNDALCSISLTRLSLALHHVLRAALSLKMSTQQVILYKDFIMSV